MIESVALEPSDAPETEAPIGAGRSRGLLLHKIMDEALTGELADDAERVLVRARELLAEFVMDSSGDASLPDPAEICATSLRTLRLPEVAALRERLVPEWHVYANFETTHEALAGRIDAIAYESGRAEVVVD
ncbi:hypothetical protein ACQR0Y_27255 [Bradyrhizobium oligotrophicum]|uniref:hypothetical protein n=1 Tax=Bradyrhizobium TaxID=374 RepID=UPI0028EF421E|nr:MULTISPECIES: hypothetical protein [unclassified Bradyrhizobium]